MHAFAQQPQNRDAAVARYDVALAQYQKVALSGHREVADSLVAIQKFAERRVAAGAACHAPAGVAEERVFQHGAPGKPLYCADTPQLIQPCAGGRPVETRR
jgi:hypothetical protein